MMIGSHPLSPLDLAATVILLAAVIDDVKTKKFHNWLFACCATLATGVVIAFAGVGGLFEGVLGGMAGVLVFLPLVLTGIVGAGDMKLMAAFGIVAGWHAVIATAFWALVWGSLFGVLRAMLNGQGRVLVSNLFSIVALRQRQGLELHRMPFTFAILMGWLSYEAVPGVLS